MSTLYKYNFDATSIVDSVDARIAIINKVADVFSSFNNVQAMRTVQASNYEFRTFNVGGGNTENFVFVILNHNQINYGLIKNGYDPTGNYQPNVSWQYFEDQEDRTTLDYWHNIFYFLVDDSNNLLMFLNRIAGFIMFYELDSNSYAECQGRCTTKYIFHEQESTQTNAISTRPDYHATGTSSFSVDAFNLRYKINDGLEFIDFTGAKVLNPNIDNYNMPTGKMLKCSNVKLNNLLEPYGNLENGAQIMIGNGIVIDGSQSATFKKINATINNVTKKYVHIGAMYWMPYDSIVIHNETV